MITRFMDTTSSKQNPAAPAAGGAQRLVLVAATSAALLTLAWAAMRVRELQLEVHGLREELAGAHRVERAKGAASRAIPVVDYGARSAEWQRRLAETEAREKHAAEKSAAREKELDEVIKFLREENEAAQLTIERLSTPVSPPASTATGSSQRKGR